MRVTDLSLVSFLAWGCSRQKTRRPEVLCERNRLALRRDQLVSAAVYERLN